MKPEYSIAWGVVALLVGLAEFVPGLEPLHGAAFALALIIEAVALGRPKFGDTMSEHLWAFYAGKWARIPLLVGLSLFFGVRIYELGFDPVSWNGLDVGRASLCSGFVGWFVPHLIGRGRWG